MSSQNLVLTGTTKLNKNTFTKTGYTFNGWNTSANGSGTAYEDEEEVLLSVSTTLYAQWKINSYSVTFKDFDGAVLKTETVQYGSSATPPNDPEREGYTFIGWDKSYSSITSDTVIIAQYSIRAFTVTWKNWNGDILKTDENVEYGSIPAFTGNEPTRNEDVEYKYSFAGWSPIISEVYDNQIYVAQYSATKQKYSVVFTDYDDSILKNELVEYGSSATAPSNPSRTGYTFIGWDREFNNIAGALTVKAQYEINKYTITFKNYDGTILQESKWEYDSLPCYNGETPVREMDGEYIYTFSGWDSQIVKATEDKEYIAQYASVAGGACGEKLIWTYSSGMLSISGTGSMNDYSSEYVNYELVPTSPWFKYADDITEIQVDNGVTTIGKEAFEDLTSVSKITIPKSVTSIGEYALYHVPVESAGPIGGGYDYEFGRDTTIPGKAFNALGSLKTVVFPNGITTIPTYCFLNSNSVAEVTLPSSLVTIGTAAFYETSIEEIIIPDGATKIGNEAFRLCNNLTKIVLPSSLEDVSGYAFKDSPKLTSVGPTGSDCNIEYGWGESIPENAFSHLTSLTDVELPNGLKSIGKNAFSYCDLRDVIVPEGVESICNAAFASNTNLETIDLPESVINIGDSAFAFCDALKSITIPQNVEELGEGLFTNSANVVVNVYQNSVGYQYVIDNNIAYNIVGIDVSDYCVTFEGDNAFTLYAFNSQKHWDGELYYSVDLVNWNIWQGNAISAAKGSDNQYYLYLRGKGNSVITPDVTDGLSSGFTLSNYVDCYGNIETLLDYETVLNSNHPSMGAYCFSQLFKSGKILSAPRLEAVTLSEGCYANMFKSCTSLTTPPELPAVELKAHCYEGMFKYCSALSSVPALNATQLAFKCYYEMFRECTSLQSVPKTSLPALELEDNCYYTMFYGCKALKNCPDLPATSLAESCYWGMFGDCDSLESGTDLPATELASYCYSRMYADCDNLITASKIYADSTSLQGCIDEMYLNCTKLTEGWFRTEHRKFNQNIDDYELIETGYYKAQIGSRIKYCDYSKNYTGYHDKNYSESSTYLVDSPYTPSVKFFYEINKYDITFVDEDGTTVLKTSNLEYGAAIAAPADPSKAATAQYT